MNETPILKRRYRTMDARSVMFVDIKTRECAFEEGPVQLVRAVEWGDIVPLADVLRIASDKAESVYIVGGWSAASSPATEWFEAPSTWRRVAYNRNPFIAIYRNGERKVTIYSTAQWFGDCSELATIRAAYKQLRFLLRSFFGPGAILMGTPARTGLDLIEKALPESKDGQAYEYPVLDADAREIIEHNIGQGRMEMLPIRADVPATDKLYVVDAVWMYSACCRRLPSPPLEHDYSSDFAGYRVGFYKVRFQVPAGWDHIGLLPTWHPRQHRSVYPAKPGDYWYTAVVCNAELGLALQHHWPVQIVERWLFADEKAANSDPLETWINRLRMLREKCSDDASQTNRLLRGAIRAIVLKAIGSMHRRGRYEQVETPIDLVDQVPADAEILWKTATHLRWKKPIPLAKEMAHFQHSEWSAMVWGRARARLASAALQFPRSSIIALRSDAIVLATDPGAQFDPAVRTKPGDFRLKETYNLFGGPLPTTSREYLDLRKYNRPEYEINEGGDDEEEGE